jgi:hypothetical protein
MTAATPFKNKSSTEPRPAPAAAPVPAALPLLAMEAAGRFRRFSDKALLGELRRVASLVAGHFSQREFLRHSMVGPATIIKRFGSWPAALAKVGVRHRIVPRAVGRKHTWEECFANLDMLWRRYGRPPRRYEVDARPSAVGSMAYIARFGSWRAALDAFEAHRRGDKHAWPMPGAKPGKAQKAMAHGRAARAAWAALRVQRGYSSVRGALRLKIMTRDHFRCVLCGASPAADGGRTKLVIDHKKPLRLGGTSDESNLRTLCAPCNLGRRLVEGY